MPNDIAQVHADPANPTADAGAALEGLTPLQQQVLLKLAEGFRIVDVAAKFGVHRRTVHRWLAAGGPLREPLRQLQEDRVESGRARLIVLSDRCIDIIEKAVDNNEDVRTALRVLEKIGILDGPPLGKPMGEVRRDHLKALPLSIRGVPMYDDSTWEQRLAKG